MAAIGKDMSYFIIDWSEELRENTQLIGTMLHRILADAASGSLQPLPRTVFSFRDAVEAYRYMAQARHTGRVLLRQNPAIALTPERTYLMTGGLGGVGLLAAARLVERGARTPYPVGSSEPSREALAPLPGWRNTARTSRSKPAMSRTACVSPQTSPPSIRRSVA